MQRLGALDPRYHLTDIPDLPEPLAMFRGLWSLHMLAGPGGSWRWLSQLEDGGFTRVKRWTRRIGAMRTLAYLAAIERTFPRGRVPSTEDARDAALEAMEERALRVGDEDPLRMVDAKHAGPALRELATRLRRWLVANNSLLQRRLAALKPPPAPRPAAASAAAFARQFAEAADAEVAASRAKAAGLKELAREAGLVPWRGDADVRRHERFVAAAEVMTAAQWAEVAARYHKARRQVDAAMNMVLSIDSQLQCDPSMGGASYRQRRERAFAARNRLRAAIDMLPRQATVNGRKVGVALGAHQASNAAGHIARLQEWFALTPEGQAHAAHVFRLFHGLARWS